MLTKASRTNLYRRFPVCLHMSLGRSCRRLPVALWRHFRCVCRVGRRAGPGSGLTAASVVTHSARWWPAYVARTPRRTVSLQGWQAPVPRSV